MEGAGRFYHYLQADNSLQHVVCEVPPRAEETQTRPYFNPVAHVSVSINIHHSLRPLCLVTPNFVGVEADDTQEEVLFPGDPFDGVSQRAHNEVHGIVQVVARDDPEDHPSNADVAGGMEVGGTPSKEVHVVRQAGTLSLKRILLPSEPASSQGTMLSSHPWTPR